MEESKVTINVESIMADIRQRAKAQAGLHSQTPRYLRPEQHTPSNLQPPIHSQDLGYLNANWNNWAQMQNFASHRPLIGPLIVRMKRFFSRLLIQGLFEDYFKREQQYQANLVRYLNYLAQYIDKRDSELFWQVISKIDSEVSSTMERSDRMNEELVQAVRKVSEHQHR